MTDADPNAPTCCACSGKSVARVVDGVYRKPVCAVHRRLYGERGYLLDALLPTRLNQRDADLTLRDEVAEVLREHGIYGFNGSEVACRCSHRHWRYVLDWHAHVTDALLPLLARVREEGSIAGQMRHITAGVARGDVPLSETEEMIADLRARVSHVEAERDDLRAGAEQTASTAVAREHMRMVEQLQQAQRERDQRHDAWAQSVKNEAALHREIEAWRADAAGAERRGYEAGPCRGRGAGSGAGGGGA